MDIKLFVIRVTLQKSLFILSVTFPFEKVMISIVVGHALSNGNR
jgi:hypothetical protein